MATTYDDYYKNQLKLLIPQMNTAISESDSIFEKQRAAVKQNYAYETEKAEKAYDDSYRENAVQKLINERQVAESMANMGLTDSGLNRTQQTAVQLSYANNKASIDRQKQAQVDALAQQLAATLSEIDINKSTAVANIKSNYETKAAENAASLYKADVDAQTTSRKSLATVKQKALEIYNEGGNRALDAYIDSLGLSESELAEIGYYIYGDGENKGYGNYKGMLVKMGEGLKDVTMRTTSKMNNTAKSAADNLKEKVFSFFKRQ